MKEKIALSFMLLSSLNAGHGMQPQTDTQYQIPAIFMLTQDLRGYLGKFLGKHEMYVLPQSPNMIFRYEANDEKIKQFVDTYPQTSRLNLQDFRLVGDKGLIHLKTLSNLTSLNLGGCNKITDQGLNHLSNLSKLTSLNLGGIPFLRNWWLKNITPLLNLTSLNLGDCRITRDVLWHLQSLTNLTSLNLRGCDFNTYERHYVNVIQFQKPLMGFLSCLIKLTSLNLGNCKFSEYTEDNEIQNLSLLTDLTSLNLRDAKWSGKNYGFLKGLTNLRYLNLEDSFGSNGTCLSGKVEEDLRSLVNLTSLKLLFRIEKTKDLKYLEFLTCPTSLSLHDFFMSRNHSFEESCLSSLTNLTALISDCIDLSKGKLDYLRALPNLTSLDLRGCGDISNQGLKTVRDLTTLKSLGLCVRINGASESLELLNSLTNVSSLSLWCSDITDGGLDHLKSLTTITSLSIWESSDLETLPNGSVRSCRSNINITDGGLIHLATLSNLKSLSLRDSNITDLGLEYMTLLTSLTSLKLDNFSEITDGGLKHLTALTNLTELDHNKDFRKRKESRYYIYYHCPHVFENGFQRYKLEDDELSRQRGWKYEGVSDSQFYLEYLDKLAS